MTKRGEQLPVPVQAEAPAPFTPSHVASIQALVRGDANQAQQREALDWIIVHAARTYDLPYRPGGADGARATDFACGRAFVGQQIVKLTKLKLGQLKEEGEIPNDRHPSQA